MAKWRGDPPKISSKQYVAIRRLHRMRAGNHDPHSEVTLASFARAQGLPVSTVYSAANRGIKQYDYEAARAES